MVPEGAVRANGTTEQRRSLPFQRAGPMEASNDYLDALGKRPVLGPSTPTLDASDAQRSV
jgi:hypothetical protein